MGVGYLSHSGAATAQASLHKSAVSPDPPLLAYTKYESAGMLRTKYRPPAMLNCCACVFRECLYASAISTFIPWPGHIFNSCC